MSFCRRVTSFTRLTCCSASLDCSKFPAILTSPGIFERNALQLLKLPVAKYSFGMALWTAAELNLEVPQEINQHIKSLLNEKKNWWTFRAQDLGMLLTGIIAQAKNRPEGALPILGAALLIS